MEMKNYAFECADICFRNYITFLFYFYLFLGMLYKQEKRYFKDIAEFVKRSFDEKFGGSWHVVCGNFYLFIGKNFGSYITYESKNIIQFWINHICFLIFKFG